MTFSTNFLNNFRLIMLLLMLSLAACAGIEPDQPPLTITSSEVVLQGSPVARRGALHWRVTTSGGAGSVTSEVLVKKNGAERLISSGGSATGSWTPKEPGLYRVKVIAIDAGGTVADSGWSDEHRFAPQLDRDSLYAVLPLENLSDTNIPQKDIQATLRARLSAEGFNLLEQASLDKFMAKHRMRHVGGLNRNLSRKMQDELGVAGVFVTSLESWQEDLPPQVSLIIRVISTGEVPEVFWIDSIGLTGDDAPGLLGLGRIKSPRLLLQNALEKLLASYHAYLTGHCPEYLHIAATQQLLLTNVGDGSAEVIETIKNKHQPQFFYRASTFNPAGQYTVAVIPFLNINARKHAEKIVALHLVEQLNRYANIRVFEPGLVRETLLRYRMIMQQGPSLAAADILASKDILGADLILSGRVFDYQGEFGESKVDFSVQIFDGIKREVIWASRSYATGNQGVYFFDWGWIPSAHGLSRRMTQAVVRKLEE